GLKPSIISNLKFWWWALSLPGTRGLFPVRPTGIFQMPKNASTRCGHVGLYRAWLFFRATAIFILLFPLHIIMQLASIFPFIANLHVSRTVYTYMSSVQMYTTSAGKGERVRPDDVVTTPRGLIHQRVLGQMAHMA